MDNSIENDIYVSLYDKRYDRSLAVGGIKDL